MKKLILTIMFAASMCFGSATYSWNNSSTTSYAPNGDNMQDVCEGWYVELIEYRGGYDARGGYEPIASGYIISPFPDAPFRMVNITADIPAGTKVYMRIYEEAYSSAAYIADLGPSDSEPYYTVKEYDTGTQFQNIIAGYNDRTSFQGRWKCGCCSVVLRIRTCIGGYVNVGYTADEIYPLSSGDPNITSIELYHGILYGAAAIPSSGYAFLGWTDGISGRNATITGDDLYGKVFGATFAKMPTNFHASCHLENSSNIVVNFETENNFKYIVQSTDSLSTNSIWTTCSDSIIASNTNTSWTGAIQSTTTTSQYYRIKILDK
jgi:hypothetical protein